MASHFTSNPLQLPMPNCLSPPAHAYTQLIVLLFKTRPYSRLLLSRAVGRCSNDLGRDSNDLGRGSYDLGRGMLKYKFSTLKTPKNAKKKQSVTDRPTDRPPDTVTYRSRARDKNECPRPGIREDDFVGGFVCVKEFWW